MRKCIKEDCRPCAPESVSEAFTLNIMVFGTALSLVISLLVLDSLEADVPTVTWSARRHYCGKELTSALSVLCDGWYKRSSSPPALVTNGIDGEDSTEEVGVLLTPILGKRQALILRSANNRRRKRSGVVEECCHKSCTLSDLKLYCGEEDE